MSPWSCIIRVNSKVQSKGAFAMKLTKEGKYLTTVPAICWWISNKIEKHRRKKCAITENDAIDNIERLYRLKERGAISEKDFEELKEKLKNQI